MAQEVINTGTLPNDGKGDTLRVAGQKINNNFTQLFTTGTVADNTARQTANAAFAAANTKVSKTGDVVTGTITFRTGGANNAYPNTRIGNIESANGIDIFASNENEWAQLNWANTNYVYVDAFGIRNITPNTSVELKDTQQSIVISSNTVNWSFGSNGRITIFDSSSGEQTTLTPGLRNVVKVSSNTFNASNTSDVIFCDPNAAGGVVTVNLSANTPPGKSITIKNINTGSYNVKVSGTERAYPYIEHPTDNTFVTTFTIPFTGEVYTWVFESGVYRYIG
jgi:hypothetical protein